MKEKKTANLTFKVLKFILLSFIFCLISIVLTFKFYYAGWVSFDQILIALLILFLISGIILWKLIPLKLYLFLPILIIMMPLSYYLFVLYLVKAAPALSNSCMQAIIHKYGEYPKDTVPGTSFYKGHILLRQCEHKYFPLPNYPNPEITDI